MNSKPDSDHPKTPEQQNSSHKEVFPGSSMEQFTKDGFRILTEAIKNSNALPIGRERNFYNTHEAFGKLMNNESSHVLRLMNSILRTQDIEGSIRNKLLDEKVELLVEANDVILERVANNIDELNGVKKATAEPVVQLAVSAQLPANINGSWNRVKGATFSVTTNPDFEKQRPSNAIRLLAAKNIIRPQKFFKDIIDNSNKNPWQPRIKDKPNSLKPLALFLEEVDNGEEFSHPYQFELERFQPSDDQLKSQDPVRPKDLSNVPLIEITQAEQLDELVEDLRNCEEFAVDLEHHSYRSFMGITCLMQISTRSNDYLIDTLALRDKLHVLNEVFTKPTIVKIFHGADMDIQWLQRDLSLYVVNLFDTHQAAKVLGYPTLSLAFLLKKFCGIAPNKMFQLADWRMRPLPDELKHYAREDTHYLIYIYHMLKNELLQKGNGSDNYLRSVIHNSTQICLRRYFKPMLREDSHLDFYRKSKKLFDNRQLYALKGLYRWRDTISRQEDESTGYVLPNHMLLQIAETLPREMQGILACCNPTPPLVKSNLLELHQIILRARDQPLEKSIMKEDSRSRGSTVQIAKINVDSPLHCPHDLSKSNEFRDDLPTVLGKTIINDVNADVDIQKSTSHCSIFNTPPNSEDEAPQKKSKTITTKFLSPYQRYKLAKPYIQAAEEAAAKKAAEEAESTTSANQQHEAITEHFMTLSKRTEENKKKEEEELLGKSLLEMGGSKKRKREPSVTEDDCQIAPSNATEHDDGSVLLLNPFHFQKGKKRTSEEAFGSARSCNTSSTAGLEDNPEQTTKKGRKQKNRRKNQKAKQNADKAASNLSNDNSSKAVNNQNQNQNQNRKRNRQRKAPKKEDLEQRDFQPYDYSSVDYQQFRGGGGSAQRPQQVKQQFKSKGKKRNMSKGKSSMPGRT